ncbi:hypothetical protein [Streptomyces sp. NPDC101455]|uniref:hypothetical protein n=1 Tax=Streptomyces sp. NPDC101455 TaxID=3366142 RepID=UPI0037F8F02D
MSDPTPQKNATSDGPAGRLAELSQKAQDAQRTVAASVAEDRSMDADAVWSAAEVLRVPRGGPFTVVAAEVPQIGRQALPDITDLPTPRGITEVALALRAVRQTPRPPTPESTDDTRKS